MSVDQIVRDTLVTGLPLVPVVMAVYLVFRIRDDFDLTIDGSFVTGAAAGAVCILHGIPVVPAMTVAVLAGGAAGLITVALHVALRVPVILAGLIVSIGLFSINLRIMGTPTVALPTSQTIFAGFEGLAGDERDYATIAVLGGICLVTLGAIGLFLKTELGLALRVSGVNVRLARSQGVNDRALVALSLFLANALAGLSGILVVQAQGFADVNMGTGTLLAGIGAFLLGEVVTRPSGSKVLRAVAAVLVGEILYRLVLVVALDTGLDASDLKLATALTLVIALVAQRVGGRVIALPERWRKLLDRLPWRDREMSRA